MPAKGERSSEETRKRVSENHWTKQDGEAREITIEYLRRKRMAQLHPSLAARGITAEMVAAATAKGKRWCSGFCKNFVPEESFGHGKTIHRWCKACFARFQRESRAKMEPEKRTRIAHRNCVAKYGVNTAWYEAKNAEQGGGCGICGGPPNGKPKFSIDHNHTTNAVRGLLCTRCNIALERLDIDPDWGNKALAYLARYA